MMDISAFVTAVQEHGAHAAEAASSAANGANLWMWLIPLMPIAAVVYALTWILVLLTVRISSVAGMSSAVSAPITAFILHSPLFPMLLGFAVLVIWKHRTNIHRLKAGTEPRIGRGRHRGR